jgi:creatinine amidohydrolase
MAGGGVVHPPLYGGMGGLDKPATVVIEPELAWENYLLRPWLEQLCSEFHRQGFRAILMVTGITATISKSWCAKPPPA